VRGGIEIPPATVKSVVFQIVWNRRAEYTTQIEWRLAMNMNDNIGLNDFIERISNDHRLAVFADYEEISNERMIELASRRDGTVVEFRRFSIDGSPVGPKNIACEIKMDGENIHFNFFDATGLYAKTNDSNVAALIAAYCGMVHFEEEEQKTTIEKFVDALKKDIHAVFSDFCSNAQHTDAGTIYVNNGVSCEIQPLRDTDGQNFYVFSVASTGEQIDVVSDPVSAAMCAIKYGMVEGHGTVKGVESQSERSKTKEASPAAERISGPNGFICNSIKVQAKDRAIAIYVEFKNGLIDYVDMMVRFHELYEEIEEVKKQFPGFELPRDKQN
jgi:hypothetical protein